MFQNLITLMQFDANRSLAKQIPLFFHLYLFQKDLNQFDKFDLNGTNLHVLISYNNTMNWAIYLMRSLSLKLHVYINQISTKSTVVFIQFYFKVSKKKPV